MSLIDEFKEMIEQYYSMNEQTRQERNEYRDIVLRESKKFIDSLAEMEKKLNKKFPSNYIEFIRADGLTGFENDHFQLYLYDEKDLYEFNYGGDSGYEEMKDYLLFGQDGGSYSYFFDPNNILQKGSEAVYRVSRGALDKNYFSLLAEDFNALFNLMITNQELNEDYTFE